MSENVRPFVWNEKRLQAAQLLAEGVLTSEKIARKSKITGRQLQRWKEHPTFRAKVESLAKDLETALLQRGIARRLNRVKALNDRWERMQSVIEARAKEYKDVPGGKSGLLVHTVKGVGKGEEFQLIDLYAVDTGLLKELREHEKQAAQELGQWVEKVAPTNPDGGESYDAGSLSPEDRSRLVVTILAKLGDQGSPANRNGHAQPG